ncbi:MAG TPA: hypothetical protein VEV63_17545 [Streptosporangiaceae bacterium]|nr:hypothetical protein [Streptosporangiaceae bacterium]
MRVGRVAAFAMAIAAVGIAGQASAALAVPKASTDRVGVQARGSHLPYTDPDQAGWLTLCGTNLKPLTQGSITITPFVWRVVSDVPAPKGYFVKGAKATMFAYQPRQQTPAGAWSGTVMGAASYYSRAAHPMAQFTPIDSPLTQMTLAYPPLWDHLVQLRLYLSAPNTPPLTTHYAAADIQVIGKTWRLVAGGHSSCTAGNAVSEEVVVGMPGSRGKPKHPELGTTGPGPNSAPAAASHSSGAGAIAVGSGVGAAVVAAAIAGGLWWRRQRRVVAS